MEWRDDVDNKKSEDGNMQVNCLKCRYFFITWDKNFPRGCRLFNFKGKALPSVAVYEATGAPCINFVVKTK